jgi:hypothetical protein
VAGLAPVIHFVKLPLDDGIDTVNLQKSLSLGMHPSDYLEFPGADTLVGE